MSVSYTHLDVYKRQLYEQYGYYLEGVRNFAFAGKAGMEKIAGIMAALRENPPKELACLLYTSVADGHTAAVFVSFERKPTMEQMIERWRSFVGRPQTLGLPSAPHPFLYYFQEDNRPQTRLDRDAGRGMAVSIGRLRPDTQYDYKFVCLSHNTLRGAAGGAVLIAELLCAEGYMG